MTLSITDGSTTVSPTLILGYKSQRVSKNIEHDLVSGGFAVSLRAATLRKGTLEQFYTTETDASDAEQLHIGATRFTLVYTDRPTVEMTYVVAAGGKIERELDKDTRRRWVVRVDFQEVLA